MQIDLGSWQHLLSQEIKKPYFFNLCRFLDEERKNRVIYPKEEDVFTALVKTPLSKVKVVLIGQDPYHGENQAHGLSFSVPKEVKIPPSLKNLYKEIQADLNIHNFRHGDLSYWAEQGVLLLNTILTVEAGKPKSHENQGWELFTDAIIDLVLKKEDPVVFLLLGKKAEEKIPEHLKEKGSPHFFLKAAHPSPFSAHLFNGCRVFSAVNRLLVLHQKKPIDWSVF